MRALVLATILAAAQGASAQWLDQKAKGIPRLPDGSPNLTAPLPRTADGKPDLSGMWQFKPNAYGGNILVDVDKKDVVAEVARLYEQHQETLGRDDESSYKCLPFGPRYFVGFDHKITQSPELITFLYEDLTYRQIFLDGRSLPKDPNPSFMGYSVGHWDGDTLVIDSNGFNTRTWIDGGHSHSEQLRITERYHRVDFGHMDVEVTLSDPTVVAKPWTVAVKMDLTPDMEMIEYVCAENEKDKTHLVGTASDDKKNAVTVAPAILSKYVGTYEFRLPEDPKQIMTFHVLLDGGKLFWDFEGKDPLELTALSNTLFTSAPGRMEFVEENGRITHFVFQAVEGDYKAIRK